MLPSIAILSSAIKVMFTYMHTHTYILHTYINAHTHILRKEDLYSELRKPKKITKRCGRTVTS